ncbi:MAG: helix-turn-helix domain-containing protein [bacterium]
MTGENLRLIWGIKLKQFRLKKGYALKELAEKTNLSISFLSEIEKGKKYPKPEKIMQLAGALGVSFDELVSLKVDEELDALTTLLDSPFLHEFPFELFGITPRNLMALLTNAPSKAGAFIRTFLEIGQTYDMRVEHFILAALRSYQKMHLNYFADIEQSVIEFIDGHHWQVAPRIDTEQLRSVLVNEYGFELMESSFENYDELRGFRSVRIKGLPHKLIINKNLLPIQKSFLLGREIGFCYLDLKEKPTTSTWIKVESFEQVLNNFKASYFAGALLINQNLLKKDLTRFFQRKRWNGQEFLHLMKKYEATPEMFLYRLSQLIPKFFDLHEIFYLRFNNESGTDIYRLTKELNMSQVRVPHGIGLHEHYCRRWLSISLLKELAQKQRKRVKKNTCISAQKSKFVESEAEFFTITLARPLALTEGTNSSISIGFLINKAFKKTVRFWNDPEIPEVEVNETCERCGFSEDLCHDRVAPPHIIKQEQNQKIREAALQQFEQEMANR